VQDQQLSSLRFTLSAILGVAGPIDEVANDVLVAYWEHPERFEPQRGSLRGYLRLRARTAGIDHLRSEQARHLREERVSMHSAPSESIEDACLRRSEQQRVRAAVSLLPPFERAPIALAYLHGMSYRSVAIRLGQPEGTTKSRIRSGMARLRIALEEGPGALATTAGGR
jgi:RNA polymerase sigma-70 factor (ECF subfamily)